MVKATFKLPLTIAEKEYNARSQYKIQIRDFPGGSVDQNLPAKARNMGSIPGPGRFQTSQSN